MKFFSDDFRGDRLGRARGGAAFKRAHAGPMNLLAVQAYFLLMHPSRVAMGRKIIRCGPGRLSHWDWGGLLVAAVFFLVTGSIALCGSAPMPGPIRQVGLRA